MGYTNKLPIKNVFNRLPGGGKKMMLIPLALLLLIALVLFYLFGIKATVLLHISPKKVEQQQKITISSNGSTDLANHAIAGEIVSISKDGSESTPATGKKQVGDKAKGTVTILSSLTESKTIPSGTVVTSSNNLAFVLDSDVKIASSSGVSDIESVSAGVSAKDIGKDYNLPSGTKFSVGVFDKSSVEAKNDSAFSGGNKKDVTVVAKADLTKLETDVVKSIENDARTELKAKASSDKQVLPDMINTLVSDKTFDKKVGDEATTVSIKAKVTFEAIAYKKDDAVKLAKFLLQSNTDVNLSPSGDPTYEIKDVKVINEKQEEGTIAITSLLVPNIDERKLAKDIAGHSFADATAMLSKIPQVSKITITISPPLPFFPQNLPRRLDSITIQKNTNE